MHISERVIHPAYVPLVVKTQPAGKGRGRYTGISGRLLCHRNGAGSMRADNLVHALHERDRFKVLMAAMHIGNPFTSGTRIIAIQHGGNGINTQPVNTISLHPEQRVTRQKIAHFGAAKIVNERVPVAMKSFARIGIFIQRRAVELCQTVRIRREMCGHPIYQHT